MNRNAAHTFIQLYVDFQSVGVKIVDYDARHRTVELEFATGLSKWYDYWTAAKVIEAESDSAVKVVSTTVENILSEGINDGI